MAEIILDDVSVTINAVDLSDHVKSIKINYSAESHGVTAMGDDTRNKLPGLKDWNVDIEFNQDYAASEVDATLFSLVGASSFTVTFKPTSGAVSATNPSFSGSALLTDYDPISGTVGEPAAATIKLEGTGDLTRATS